MERPNNSKKSQGINTKASTKKRKHSKSNDSKTTKKIKESKNNVENVEICWWQDEKSFNENQSCTRGRNLLSRLFRLQDMTLFEREVWQKEPYLNQLNDKSREEVFSDTSHPMHMLSMTDIKQLLKRVSPSPARYLKDVDVTRYHLGKRMSLVEGDGEVNDTQVWEAYNEGYSIRCVHPQQWHQPLFELCSYLQEYFGFPTGCSSYLTPAESQGYPPHFDDVEIFVVQLEGKKRWRLYDRPDVANNPKANITKEFKEDQLGPPTHDFVLCPGDVLYFPRGTIHQAISCAGSHSLHLTFSTYQNNTWLDLLNTISLEKKQQNQIALMATSHTGWINSGLPLDLLDQYAMNDKIRQGWECFSNQIESYNCPEKVVRKLKERGVLEQAVDVRGQEFYYHCLPPPKMKVSDPDIFQSLDDNQIDQLVIFPQAKYCMRMSGLGKYWDKQLNSLEEDDNSSEGLGQVILLSNTGNGRSFSSPTTPPFEVLPHLFSSVLTISTNYLLSDKGVKIGDLEAMKSESQREDMLDLLELMIEYKVIYVEALSR
jgi:hypothetical protein